MEMRMAPIANGAREDEAETWMVNTKMDVPMNSMMVFGLIIVVDYSIDVPLRCERSNDATERLPLVLPSYKNGNNEKEQGAALMLISDPMLISRIWTPRPPYPGMPRHRDVTYDIK